MCSKFRDVWHGFEIYKRTDRHIDTDMLITILHVPTGSEVIIPEHISVQCGASLLLGIHVKERVQTEFTADDHSLYE